MKTPTWSGWSPVHRNAGRCTDSKTASERGRRGLRALERAAQLEEPLAAVDRDPVEHDRRDHLVGADGRLEDPGDPAPDHPGERSRRRSRGRCGATRGVPGEVRADVERGEEAHEVLALAADVEHPAAERERDRDRREDERREDDERLLEVAPRRPAARPRSTRPGSARCPRRSPCRCRAGCGRSPTTTRPPTRKARTVAAIGHDDAAEREPEPVSVACVASWRLRSLRLAPGRPRPAGRGLRGRCPRSRHRLLPAAAGHGDAELLLGRRRACTRRRCAPSYMTRIRSESDRISSSSKETSRIARPSSRSSTSRRWTNSIAPTSRPRVGCAAMRTSGLPADLARDDDLLLVAARERRGRRLRAAAAHVELLQQLPRPCDQPARVEPAEARVGRLARSRGARGSRRARSRARARAGAGPRGCGRCPASRRRLRASPTVTSFAGDDDPARGGLAQAGDRVDELALAVAVHARDADDLARAHLEARRPRTASSPRSSTTCRSVDREQRLAGLAGALLDAQEHLAPDHEPREALLGRALPRDGLDRLAAPEHGDPVGDLEHLVQLVRDEDDRLPLGLERLDDLEELLRLLRREHGGRLVEDEDLGAAVERLQDLDALLLADRDRSRPARRVERRGRTAARARARAARRRRCRGRAARRLGREHDVLGDRHDRDEHEVLVHHPDPEVDRVARRADRRPACRSAGSRPRRACRARRGCS